MKRLISFLIFATAASALFVLAGCDSENCQHEYSEISVEPDCEKEVIDSRVCLKCGEIKESVIPPKGHDFSFTVKNSTCNSAGYTEFKCDCGFTYKSDIKSALGHSYVETILLPTCTESGFTSKICELCGDSFATDYTDALGHDMVEEKHEPSCTEQGFTSLSCSHCDYSFDSGFTNPTGHSLISNVVAPSCTVLGFTEYTCSICNYKFAADYVKPIGHNHIVSDTVSPTCTQAGYSIYACNCGDTYSTFEAPLGHMFTKSVVSPTVSDMGYTEFSCECGFNYIGNYLFYSEILDNAYAGTNEVFARGIDISKWNHKVDSNGEYVPIDWEALKAAGVDYVILKIGSSVREDGSLGGLEPTFEMDYHGAKAAGIDVGVYYFTYSTNVSGIKADAEQLLTYLEGKQFEYPIYLDIEDAPDEDYYPSSIASPILTEMCLTFFSTLQKEGYYTGLYVNNEFLYNILQTENMIDLFEIWYARYPDLNDCQWSVESFKEFTYGDAFGMWQYTMTGVLEPILGDVDFNYAYKDFETIVKTNGFNGYCAE